MRAGSRLIGAAVPFVLLFVAYLIPFVLAYIVYAWWAIDKKKLDKQEIADDHAY